MNGERYTESALGQWLMRLAVAAVITLIGVGGLMVKGCQKGPFGRKQVVALNAQQEAKLGLQAYEEVLSKSDVLPQDSPVVKAVKEVAQRLEDAAGNREFLAITRQKDQPMDWEVRVVRSKEVNAFCLPGGKIVVYTGILPVCETDAGLATVMGHEISHALAHHGAERMAQTKMAQIALGAAGTSMSDMDPDQRQAVLKALNAGAQVGILKYSRTHETEADHMGLFLMAAAGYDPHEAVKFWERMQKATGKGGRPPEFLSTHPSHETRIRDLNKWIPDAMPLYKASGRTEKPRPLPGVK